MLLRALFVLLALQLKLLPADAQASMGPYDCLKIQQLSMCPDSADDIIIMNVTVKNYGEGRYGYGHLKVPVTLEENECLKVIFDKWSNGWKGYYVHTECGKLCEAGLNTIPELLDSLAVSSEFACPMKPGEFNVSKMPLCTKYSKFPNMPYGKFRVTLLFVSKDDQTKRLGCVQAESIIEPAIKKFG